MTLAIIETAMQRMLGAMPSWRLGPRLWIVWSLVMFAGLSFSGAAGVAWWRASDELLRLRSEIDERRAETPSNTESLPTKQPATVDFTASLPRSVDDQVVVAELQRSCSNSGVVLTSVQIQQHAAMPSALLRHDMNIALRGNYAAIKEVLRAALSRYPNMTLRNLTLRNHRTPESVANEVEAVATLAAWGAPQNPSLEQASPEQTVR